MDHGEDKENSKNAEAKRPKGSGLSERNTNFVPKNQPPSTLDTPTITPVQAKDSDAKKNQSNMTQKKLNVADTNVVFLSHLLTSIQDAPERSKEPYMCFSLTDLVRFLAQFENDQAIDLLNGDLSLIDKLKPQDKEALAKNLIPHHNLYSKSGLVKHIVDTQRESMQQKIELIQNGRMPDARMPKYGQIESFLHSAINMMEFTVSPGESEDILKNYTNENDDYSIEITSEKVKYRTIKLVITKTGSYRGIAENKLKKMLADLKVFKQDDDTHMSPVE